MNTAWLACAPECGWTLAKLQSNSLLGPLDRQLLGDVDVLAAAVVAPAGIALGIFVGQHRALRLQHGARDDVLRGDQLDLLLLAMQLALQHRIDRRIGFGDALREHRQRYVLPLRGSLTHDFDTPESLATRPAWRPPSNGVARKTFSASRATSMPISRWPKATTLASLCSRERRAERRVMSEHRAHLGIAVGRDRDADPRAADQNSLVGLAGSDRIAHGLAEVGIIDRSRRIGAEIEYGVTCLLQVALQNFLQVEAGMIRRDRDGGPRHNRRSIPSTD